MYKSSIEIVVPPTNTLNLLTIRGKLKAKALDEARTTHNQTAGSDQGVAAARSLGDLSHTVYVPLEDNKDGDAGELLILDQWNSLAGFDRFFSNPDVQAGGSMIFASREPTVWEPARDFPSCSMPPPASRRDRFIGMVAGVIKSRARTAEILSDLLKNQINRARGFGLLSREYYVKVGATGDGNVMLLGLDTWVCSQGMGAYYGTGEDLRAMRDIFAAAPAASVWKRPPGEWVEW